jgi:hypothetical protein
MDFMGLSDIGWRDLNFAVGIFGIIIELSEEKHDTNINNRNRIKRNHTSYLKKYLDKRRKKV